jgi:D-glycero-D-manno-heptose 1,7-bisphosphate phosphatase
MILQAACDLGLDLSSSAIIGDKIADMQAGEAAGIRLRIRIGARTAANKDAPPHETVADLAEALALLRQRAEPCPAP